MFNGDPPVPSVTTEQIQKYLEENKELIMAILEARNMGKFDEIAQCQEAKLQHNLTFLAKLADAGPQAVMHSQVVKLINSYKETHGASSSGVIVQQGQGMQHPHVAMSQQQPDLSTLNMPLNMNDQQQHQHPAMSLQSDVSTSKLPFQMNEQHHKQPAFFHQHQLIPGPMGGFPVTNNGIYQALQTRLGSLSDTPPSNQIGSDFSPDWF